MNVYVCSNPKCRAVWDEDPQGHCPECDRTHLYPAPGSVGFSTSERKVQNPAKFRAQTQSGRDDSATAGE